MAFIFHKSLKGSSMPPLVRVIIDNSDVISLGDAVRCYNAGNVEVAAAAKAIFGFVHDVQDKNGLTPTPDAGTLDTWTVAADNETVDLKAALIDVDQDSVYSAPLDAAIGTTNTSSKIGVSFDIANEYSVGESTALRSGQGQLYGWGADPNDSTRVLVSILESERRAGGVY